MAFPLARLGFDHIPIHIQVGTHIPNAQLFRIENYWFEFDGIMELINKSWNMAPIKKGSALNITAKFKYLRASLKNGAGIIQISTRSLTIAISLWPFLIGLKNKETFLLWIFFPEKSLKHIQQNYWKQKEYIGKTEQK
jgi:hypothetical protein